MANIMMTDVCNLRCPYCFANEFVNKDINEITEEAFLEAVDFIVGDGTCSNVGIIGGEPTIHSKFNYLMRKLLVDKRVNTVMLYTNGLNIYKYWDIVCHSKMHILINCNSPTDMGEINYKILSDNIRILVEEKLCRDRVTLGINLYNPDFEYEYLIELLKKFSFKHVRVSITVPNLDKSRNTNPFDYFTSMKPRLFEFFHKLMQNDIVPHFDCNKIPFCLIGKEECHQFDVYLSDSDMRNRIEKSNIADDIVCCDPVIDIRQDLSAVRCFGLSSCTKQDIRNFNGIKELRNFYMRSVDAYAYNTVYAYECIDCHLRKVTKCTGGCLAYKINEIIAMEASSEDLMKKYR